MSEWWKNNWHKLIPTVAAVLISGVVAILSAVIATGNKIDNLETRVGILEKLDAKIKNAEDRTGENTTAINNLANRFDSMKDRVDLGEVRVAAMKELTELQRQKTVNELEELLDKYGKVVGKVKKVQ